MTNYIKTMLKKPNEIYTARNMKKKDFFSLLLSMGLLLTLLSIFSMANDFKTLTSDYKEIQAAIPDFELADHQLESKKESFIYETDSLVFYFDPQDKVGTQLIDKNIKKQNAPISLALKKEEIYLNILGSSQSVSYADLNMTSQDLKNFIYLNNFSSPLYLLIVFVLLFLFNLFIYITQLFSISIFSNLVSLIQNSKLNYFQNTKITLVASIIPFSIMAILNSFNLSINYQFELTSIATLTLFYLSISEFKKRLNKNKKTN